MPGSHALLSPSSAHRWLHCTAAPRLEAVLPDTAGEAAAEGTLAHAVAELLLTKAFTPMGPRKYSNALKRLQADPLYTADILRHAEGYRDYVKGLSLGYNAEPYIAIEAKLDLTGYVPDGMGTADCILIGGDTLNIIDYKYGKGVEVSAEANPQMMLYALGALDAYSLFYGIRQVQMTIYQPRRDNISTYTMAAQDLIQWGMDVVRPAADVAYTGQGEYCPGDWCRWCRARGQCRAQTKRALDDFDSVHQDTGLMTPGELAAVLPMLPGIKAWLSDVETVSLRRALDGEAIPGYKIVEGRTSRGYADMDACFDAVVAAGVDPAMLYERKPITVPALEKLLGKQTYNDTAAQYVQLTPGKPTLVPSTDKRPEYSPRNTAAEDFKEVI